MTKFLIQSIKMRSPVCAKLASNSDRDQKLFGSTEGLPPVRFCIYHTFPYSLNLIHVFGDLDIFIYYEYMTQSLSSRGRGGGGNE